MISDLANICTVRKRFNMGVALREDLESSSVMPLLFNQEVTRGQKGWEEVQASWDKLFATET